MLYIIIITVINILILTSSTDGTRLDVVMPGTVRVNPKGWCSRLYNKESYNDNVVGELLGLRGGEGGDVVKEVGDGGNENDEKRGEKKRKKKKRKVRRLESQRQQNHCTALLRN